MARRKARNGNLGKHKDLVSVGPWEDIPEQKNKGRVEHYNISSDLKDALIKAQLDAEREFSKKK